MNSFVRDCLAWAAFIVCLGIGGLGLGLGCAIQDQLESIYKMNSEKDELVTKYKVEAAACVETEPINDYCWMCDFGKAHFHKGKKGIR